ncbi:MAG: hypothetical protein E2O82_00300, partial [Betaproteobacteria bacterium]
MVFVSDCIGATLCLACGRLGKDY